MEVALTRTNMLESNQTIMTRFLHGLNQDIQNIIEGKEKEKRPRKDKSLKKGSSIPQGLKEERTFPSPTPVSKSNNIKCFKCLGNGHIPS
ncbi:hypothetical protein CR513_29492, partial [Mucuna pruriens]